MGVYKSFRHATLQQAKSPVTARLRQTTHIPIPIISTQSMPLRRHTARMGILMLFALGAWPATALATPPGAYPPEKLAKENHRQPNLQSNHFTAADGRHYIVPHKEGTDAAAQLMAHGCTTTIRNNNIPCYWDGTQTLYSATRTLTAPVDCHGCSDIHVQQDVYFCPVEKIYTTSWATNPSTTWITVCATSTQKAVNLNKKDFLTNDAALPGRTRAPQPEPTRI
ncbi:hypothetical protein PgNI_11120 [Pyricularia grisea]|uniref:Uncharacterized protein n=1 Tax=Pyricularia grisea TaxID=148305 RepID=A0A6P8APR9_PYRGI|nr:hypothetical protein PgNI_11120 [Pyricularia grisea]TLD04013.1 hypothetical protein PgNI_11120 [Pyricularia grisea]